MRTSLTLHTIDMFPDSCTPRSVSVAWRMCLLAVLGLTAMATIQTADRRYCNGRGYRDGYGLCRCIDSYHGQNCEYSEYYLFDI
jgi:hypothetical protein